MNRRGWEIWQCVIKHGVHVCLTCALNICVKTIQICILKSIVCALHLGL